jgi:hypothetical protein
MTALVVKFKAQEVGDGGGVQARRKEREETMRGDEDGTSQAGDSDHEGSPDITPEPIEL